MARRRPNRAEYAERRDGHHVLNYRAQWDAMIGTAALRAMPGLIVDGPRPIHDELHRNVECVPPLTMHVAQHTLNYYQDRPEDNLRSIDNFMRSVDRAIRHPKASEMEKVIAQMAIHAVELQLPYIEEMVETQDRRRLFVV